MTTTFKARTTYYNGIKMRSRLEASYAQGILDGRVRKLLPMTSWEYEPCCFANEHGQWLPDFVIRDIGPNGMNMYIEVKPLNWLCGDRKDDLDHLMLRMSAVWAAEPRAVAAIDFAEWPVASDNMQPRISRSGRGTERGRWLLTIPKAMPGLAIQWADPKARP